METIVRSDKEILGGTPCFAGTRVPVKSLFDYLEGGYPLAYFLSQFPSVKHEAAVALLEAARKRTEAEALADAKG